MRIILVMFKLPSCGFRKGPLRADIRRHALGLEYFSVLPHPFFAVSGVDGAYKIAGLPPGQYTIVAWHEKYGEQTFDVSVGRQEQKMLDFTFTAPNN
jgi:carboxypeptidase family protein